MDIIDFHTHTFPDDLAARAIASLMTNSPESRNHTDGTISGLLKSMENSGIKHSVVLPVATKPSQVPVINQNSLRLKCKLITAFGALHPQTPNVEQEIAFLKENNIPGIKFHPEYQNFYVDDKALFPVYEQLSAASLIVVFHAGKDPGPFTCDHALPCSLKRVHKNFPSLRIVAAHMGGWKLWDEVEQHLCGLPVFLDTSAISDYISEEQFRRIVNKHGADNILFGTDSPWFDQSREIRWLDSMDLSNSVKSRIFYENGRRLLT
jgi:predicted TIM-barrel fold metal-dependent hydrolase